MVDKLGKIVLVIDDEPDVRLFLRTVLEDAGFDVVMAANGKEALERVTERIPDAISLDLVMPKMSGLKFYKYIQKNKERSRIPVIVLTAHGRDELGKGDLTKIKAAKTEDSILLVLEKPVEPSLYINAIRQSIGLPEVESEETSEKDRLRMQLKEKLKTADKKALEEALKLLEKD